MSSPSREVLRSLGLPAGSLVLDTTGPPQWLTGGTAGGGVFRFRAEAGRRYLAVDPAATLSPEVRIVPSRLRSTTHRADWLLLAPREFLPAASPLVDLRREQGLLVKTVAMEDVYQEFGFGEAGPEAIRAFLAYAWQSWKKPSPRYVVLLGDSTYDPKDYLQTHVADRLPFYPVKTSFLWTASDPAYASVNGDDLVPDLAIGRLPAGSLVEAETLVGKLVAFERSGQTLDGKAVLVADNADLAGNFEADADDLAATVLQDREVEKIYLRDQGAGTRAEIVGAFDSGSSLLSYIGHGGTAVWASENVFNNQDVSALGAQARQPLLMTMNCLNGFFHFPPLNSLAEELVKAEGKGAIAAFSPSGLSLNDAAHLYHRAVLAEITREATPPGRRPPRRPVRLRRLRLLPRAPLHLPPLRRPGDEDQIVRRRCATGDPRGGCRARPARPARPRAGPLPAGRSSRTGSTALRTRAAARSRSVSKLAVSEVMSFSPHGAHLGRELSPRLLPPRREQEEADERRVSPRPGCR